MTFWLLHDLTKIVLPKFLKPSPVWCGIIGLASITAVASCALYFGWFSGEPSYHGHSLSAWLNKINYFQPVNFRGAPPKVTPYTFSSDPGLAAIMEMKSTAASALIESLSATSLGPRNSPVDEAFDWLEHYKIPSNRHLLRRSTPLALHQEAAAGFALIALGKTNGGGVGPLLNAISQGVAGGYGARNFAIMGGMRAAFDGLPERQQEILDGLRMGLQNPSPEVRRSTLYCIQTLPGQAAFWKKEVLFLIDDPDDNIASMAIVILGARQKPDPEMVDILEKVLNNSRNSVGRRAAAATALGNIGAESAHALPMLRKLASQTDSHLRGISTMAISRILWDAKRKNIPLE